jgi:hypothetical protein
MTDDVTIKVLIEIRDEIRQTNTRLDQTRIELSARIDQTNDRLDQTNDRLDQLGHRVIESELRTATAIDGLAATLHDVRQLLRRRDLDERVTRVESEIAELKRRIG